MPAAAIAGVLLGSSIVGVLIVATSLRPRRRVGRRLDHHLTGADFQHADIAVRGAGRDPGAGMADQHAAVG